jgi:predicted aldo/keto reductase-like oxidoreductase
MADEAIEMVLQHGINHFDIAPGYGLAMERVAPWMPEIRDKIFLGAKMTKRTRGEARESIDECMKRLNVDKFDLLQLHGIGTMEELDRATAPGGALEVLIELREQGGTQWLGITGHGPDVPKVHLEAFRRFDFDTIMFPVSAAIFRNDDYRHDAEALFAEAHRRDVGIQTIKMLAHGGGGDQDETDKALWLQQSRPIHTVPSTGSLALLPKILDAAEQQEVVDSQRPPHPEPGLGIPAAA